ncbi:hypothetical protein Taro_033587 [Colocasia esculenta]|uniref:Uncharacterized protein n=1 Tax=Colocasia esculenta TaxID=4460 RepID=A0A843W566_COLES|nr:hypothetical protein [Colocasia esculenta]
MSEEKEAAVAARGRGGEGGGGAVAAFGRCFSGLEVAMEGAPLKELDPEKLKNEIKRWAKAVVAYARQLSGSLAEWWSTRCSLRSGQIEVAACGGSREAVFLGPEWATMNKILDFGRRALFVIRVISGYEERRIRAHRLGLQKQIEQAWSPLPPCCIAQARKESLRKIPEQAILGEVRRMVEEMQTVLHKFEETHMLIAMYAYLQEAAIEEYLKPFDKNAEIIMNMQLEKEEKSAKEMLKAMRDQAILQKFEQERITTLRNATVSQEPAVNPTGEELTSNTTREEVINLTSPKPELSGTPQEQTK